MKNMTKTINLNPTCIIELGGNKQKPSESKFDAAIMDAIEDSLSSFKSFDKQEVYFHLETTFNIRKKEIPRKIEDFMNALEKIFGVGARLIEIKIIESIHKRVPEFKFTSRTSVVDFGDYVASLQAFLIRT
jgi:hypothetical protein